MPSIFKTVANAMQGKPLFDANQAQQPMAPVALNGLNVPPNLGQPVMQNQPQPQLRAQEPAINRNDSRTFPTVRVRHTATRLLNGQMEVRSRIINESPFKVDVHKVEILGTATDIRYPLSPGQDKEFLVYKGPCKQNDASHDMSIEYKTESGMYFKSIHNIRYQMNADRSFSIDELNLQQPIRHIAG
jgi:hypothetical protein